MSVESYDRDASVSCVTEAGQDGVLLALAVTYEIKCCYFSWLNSLGNPRGSRWTIPTDEKAIVQDTP